jgi:hypothetical protein
VHATESDTRWDRDTVSMVHSSALAGRNDGVAIFADPHRGGAAGFAEAIRKAGFDVSIGHWEDRQPGGADDTDAFVFCEEEGVGWDADEWAGVERFRPWW